MFAEEDLLLISALQHLIFCQRQCALIYVEMVWDENRLTIEGKHMHDRVHQDGIENRPGVRIVRGMGLRSLKYGITGKADVVEFRDGSPYPVEYKRGKKKSDKSDEVQLCAQALCLEEMMGIDISAGSLYYGQPKRRIEVLFTNELRNFTIETIKKLREIIDGQYLPKAVYSKKCPNCSLIERCAPKISDSSKSANKYYLNFYKIMEDGEGA